MVRKVLAILVACLTISLIFTSCTVETPPLTQTPSEEEQGTVEVAPAVPDEEEGTPAIETPSPTPTPIPAPTPTPETTPPPSEISRSGWIYEDETWSGTVHITGDVWVHHETTITILPGTRILFAAHQDDQHAGSAVPREGETYGGSDPAHTLEYAESHSQMDVYGTLLARGTPENMIVFTSDSSTPEVGDWSYLHIGYGSIAEYCVVEYSKGGIDVMEGTEDSVNISHNIIRHNLWTALAIHSSSPTVSHNEIYHSGGHQGIDVLGEGSAPLVTNNVIKECKVGIVVQPGTSPVIENNIIVDNDGGIRINPNSSPVIRHNSISSPNGPSQHWTFEGELVYFSSSLMGIDDYVNGITVDNCSPLITNNEVFQCNSAGISIMGNASPTIKNNEIYDNRRGILFEESFIGAPNINGNNIHDNYFSNISLYPEQPVNVINNWWGTTDLDMIQATILDIYGNPISKLVTFEPFLTRPVEIE